MAQRTTKKASPAQPQADLPTPPEGLTREETRSVEKKRRLRAAVVYEIIRIEGEGELARTKGACGGLRSVDRILGPLPGAA